MSNNTEPRKASDVLLDLEAKLDTALAMIRAQDLNIKILANKFNDIIVKLDKPTPMTPKVEAINVMAPTAPQTPPLDPERHMFISAENKIPMTDSPIGFRRTSRPETFAGDDAYLQQEKQESIPLKFPVQIPQQSHRRPEVPLNLPTPQQETQFTEHQPQIVQASPKSTKNPIVQNAIPVMQRIVDKNGKSIFLADVEVIDLANSQSIFKTRTNGTGKWMASLNVGQYRVLINKRESTTKAKIEAKQDVYVDGTQSPLELNTLIVK